MSLSYLTADTLSLSGIDGRAIFGCFFVSHFVQVQDSLGAIYLVWILALKPSFNCSLLFRAFINFIYTLQVSIFKDSIPFHFCLQTTSIYMSVLGYLIKLVY